MRTREEEIYRRTMERLLRTERLLGFRGVVTVQRRIDPAVDLQRFWVRGWTELRVTGVGNGAGPGDAGKFWYLPGYSSPTGPDVVYVP